MKVRPTFSRRMVDVSHQTRYEGRSMGESLKSAVEEASIAKIMISWSNRVRLRPVHRQRYRRWSGRRGRIRTIGCGFSLAINCAAWT